MALELNRLQLKWHDQSPKAFLYRQDIEIHRVMHSIPEMQIRLGYVQRISP